MSLRTLLALGAVVVLAAGAGTTAAGAVATGGGGRPTPGAAIAGPELRALATRARHDPAALARLRAVRRVDGRPVDLAAALRGVRGAALDARLRELARAPAPDPAPPPGARASARRILAEPRFHERSLPHPLRRPLAWLGHRLAPIGRAISRAYRAVADAIPGGPPVLWIVLGGLVVAGATLGAGRLARRRARALERGAPAGRAARREDPRELERAAAHAEAEGDFEAAVRLRFRAGLLRLDAAHVLELDPALTTGAAARRVRSPAFDALALRFDEIAYGRRPAESADARAAQEGWQRVLAERAAS